MFIVYSIYYIYTHKIIDTLCSCALSLLCSVMWHGCYRIRMHMPWGSTGNLDSRKPPFALQPCQGRMGWVPICGSKPGKRFDFEDSKAFSSDFQHQKDHPPTLVLVGGIEYQQREIRSLKDLSSLTIIRFLALQHQILSSPGKNFGSGVPVNCTDLAMGVCRI